MTTVKIKDNVLTLTRPTSFEIDVEDLASDVEQGGLYEALSYKIGGDLANDFIENNREELLVIVARYWIEQYDTKCKD